MMARNYSVETTHGVAYISTVHPLVAVPALIIDHPQACPEPTELFLRTTGFRKVHNVMYIDDLGVYWDRN